MEIHNSAPINFKIISNEADTVKEKKLHKACDDFEAILVKQLLTTMRKSIPKSGLFNDGFSNDMYQSISDDNLATNLTKGGNGIGISELLYERISGQIKGKI